MLDTQIDKRKIATSTNANGVNKMNNYLFYIEGLNREVWFKEDTEKLAHAGVWNSLTNDEQDRVIQIECLDAQTEDK